MREKTEGKERDREKWERRGEKESEEKRGRRSGRGRGKRAKEDWRDLEGEERGDSALDGKRQGICALISSRLTVDRNSDRRRYVLTSDQPC